MLDQINKALNESVDVSVHIAVYCGIFKNSVDHLGRYEDSPARKVPIMVSKGTGNISFNLERLIKKKILT